MNVMLDFICMGPVDLPGASKATSNGKVLPKVRLKPPTFRFVVGPLYQLNYQGFDKSCPIKVTFIHKSTSGTNVYIGIS